MKIAEPKKVKFKKEIDELRKKHGRTMLWIIEQFGSKPQDFYILLKADAFTDDQKSKIRSIITK